MRHALRRHVILGGGGGGKNKRNPIGVSLDNTESWGVELQ
jgi:hypothetical protein